MFLTSKKKKVPDLVFCWSQPISDDSVLGMPGDTHLGPYHLWESPRVSLPGPESVLCPTGPCGSYYDSKMHLREKLSRNFEKDLFAVLGWYTACSEPPKEGSG